MALKGGETVDWRAIWQPRHCEGRDFGQITADIEFRGCTRDQAQQAMIAGRMRRRCLVGIGQLNPFDTRVCTHLDPARAVGGPNTGDGRQQKLQQKRNQQTAREQFSEI